MIYSNLSVYAWLQKHPALKSTTSPVCLCGEPLEWVRGWRDQYLIGVETNECPKSKHPPQFRYIYDTSPAGRERNARMLDAFQQFAGADE